MLKTLIKITGQSFILPFYHAISDEIPVHLKHLFTVRNINQFKDDLDYLLKIYKPVSIFETYDHIKKYGYPPKNSFMLSFDDGLKEFKDVAFPIIKRKGIPVAIFINPGFVDNKQLFFRFKASILIEKIITNKRNIECFNGYVKNKKTTPEKFLKSVTYTNKSVLDDIAKCIRIDFDEYLTKNRPYLTLKELYELKDNGVYVGAHSIDHPLFNMLNNEEQTYQLKQSVDFVKHRFNSRIKGFSFPFTDYGLNKDFFNEIFKEEMADITFGTAGIKKEKFKYHLQRIPVENYNKEIKEILIHQYLYYIFKIPFFKNTVKR